MNTKTSCKMTEIVHALRNKNVLKKELEYYTWQRIFSNTSKAESVLVPVAIGDDQSVRKIQKKR